MRTVAEYEALKGADALTAAEKKLIAAVRAGENCLLQFIATSVPRADNDPKHTIRADLLALLITGGTPDCGLSPYGVKLVGAYITGNLRFTHLHAVGGTVLVYCSFAKKPDLRNARFQSLDLTGSHLPGIMAQQVEVRGNLFLRGVAAAGTVDLNGAKIGSQLAFDGATLDGSGDPALRAQRLEVGADLFFRVEKAIGTVILSGAKIEGELSFEHATLDGKNAHAAILQQATVGGALVWRGVEVTAGHVSLASAHVSDLVDDPKGWPEDLVLAGFTYDRITANSTRSKDRLPWLAKGSTVYGSFTPQPYTQLAKVLREMGHDGEARIVLMEREKLLAQNLYEAQRKEYLAALHGEQTQQADAGWFWISMMGARAWAALMRRVTGYGYAPQLALFWALGCVGLCAVLYFIGYAQGLMVPNSAVILTSADWATAFGADAVAPALEWQGQAAAHYETFYPIPYALDVFLPVVDLGQHAAWTQTTVTTWGVALRVFTWALQGAGYLITGLGLAAATGIIQKDRG